jgi:hypothetical protein
MVSIFGFPSESLGGAKIEVDGTSVTRARASSRALLKQKEAVLKIAGANSVAKRVYRS